MKALVEEQHDRQGEGQESESSEPRRERHAEHRVYDPDPDPHNDANDHRCFARENVILHEQEIIWRRRVSGHFCYSC